jgi:hypothetical protein
VKQNHAVDAQERKKLVNATERTMASESPLRKSEGPIATLQPAIDSQRALDNRNKQMEGDWLMTEAQSLNHFVVRVDGFCSQKNSPCQQKRDAVTHALI